MIGRARGRAASVLDQTVEAFRRAGCGSARPTGPLEARVEAPGPLALRLVMVPTGRIFGGTYALEVSTAEPVLPPTRGLSARGRGIVRLQGIAFRPRRGDQVGRELAATLEREPDLVRSLSAVHFEQIRVEPDGRAVIRHMGGSVVWILIPPVVRPIPLIPEQAGATLAALQAFAGRGRA